MRPRRFPFLWEYTSEWRGEIIRALAALTFVSASSLVYPWLLKMMVDGFQPGKEHLQEVFLTAALLLLLFLASTFLGYFQQLTMQSLGYRLRNRLRRELYEKLLHRPLAFHRTEQVGELSSRATEDISRVQPVFSGLLSPVYQNILIVGGGLLLTLFLNVTAAFVLFLFLVLPVPFVLRYSRRIRAHSGAAQAEHAGANARLEESLVAIREIKAFALEEQELGKYVSSIGKALTSEMSASRLVIRGNQSAYFLLSAMLLTMFYLSAASALPGWTLGSMVAFYFYAYTIAMSVLSVGRIYLTYQSVAGALERVAKLLRTESDDLIRNGSVRNEISGRIQLNHVTFSYQNDNPILDNLTLEVNRGEWVVISGPSGSGKSTIANLIMGFYSPIKGRVLLDDVPWSEWEKSGLLRQIGYVGQDPILFHGSIRENLLLNQLSNGALLTDVLRVTCLREMIERLPGGIETVIGERGYTISGGQRARIAIARALMRQPAILVLDEANSMLEPELEGNIWANLKEFRGDKTTVILTHHRERIPPGYRLFRIDGGALTEEAG